MVEEGLDLEDARFAGTILSILVGLLGSPPLAWYLFDLGMYGYGLAAMVLWMMLVLWVGYVIKRGEMLVKKELQERLEERKKNGIALRDDSYYPVEAECWGEGWNWRRDGFVDWLEGVEKEPIDGDVVLKWGSRSSSGYGRGGFAIERGGLIVARVVVWKTCGIRALAIDDMEKVE